jgi:hypothetical protein
MKYLLTLVLGVLVGGALVYVVFVRAPGGKAPPGSPVSAPDPAGDPPGTAVVELDEQFFNTLLGTVFKDLGEPTFRMAHNQVDVASDQSDFQFLRTQAGGCQNQVVIAREGDGVQSGVRLENAEVLAPLAFKGSYNLLGNCMNFNGTAEAAIDFRFAPAEQTLYGQLNVKGVNIAGLSPLLGGPVTMFVQNALNMKVNPLVLMRGPQIELNVPVQATGGTLKAQARDVRAEIKDKALRLHITYDFKGSKGAQPAN